MVFGHGKWVMFEDLWFMGTIKNLEKIKGSLSAVV